MHKKWLIPIVFAAFVCMAQPAAAQEDQAAGQEALAKKSQNPVGNIISVPIEYWHYDGIAEDGGDWGSCQRRFFISWEMSNFMSPPENQGVTQVYSLCRPPL